VTGSVWVTVTGLDKGFVDSLFRAGEGGIFRDSGWLQPLSPSPSGVPVGREDELRVLGVCLAGVFECGVGRNVFVFGGSGTGKTFCVRYLLGRVTAFVESKGLDVLVVYVNAGRTRSPYFTLLEVVRGLGVGVPASGWQFSRLKQEFERARRGRPVVVAIDEMESLIFKQREPLIYYLNRQPKVTLILISNRFGDVAGLPARARSTLQVLPVRFGGYEPEVAKKILKERVEKAFKPGVVAEEFVDWLSEFPSKVGDIRVCFNILLTAGLLAEREGKTRIERDHFIQATKTIQHTI
jgi:cell division control protein 6